MVAALHRGSKVVLQRRGFASSNRAAQGFILRASKGSVRTEQPTSEHARSMAAKETVVVVVVVVVAAAAAAASAAAGPATFTVLCSAAARF